jgi:lysophospholipase L1-like esterase
MSSSPLTLVSMGDSLTASYAGTPYGVGHRSWSDLLAAARPGRVVHFNFAQPGAASAPLLDQGQHHLTANIVRTFHASPGHLPGPIPFVTLIVGANDLDDFIDGLLLGAAFEPNGLADDLAANVTTAFDIVQAAGTVGVVLATVPDITATPRVRQALAGQPALTQALANLTTTINARLLALAKSRRVPVVDLHALTPPPSVGPLLIGGCDVSNRMFAADGFHPSTLGQGLLFNAILEALQQGYGVDVTALRLGERELLRIAFSREIPASA